ncbi:polysaccharide pyruvyl transferase family protein [Skermanella sp. TT6]|uniref:Polysaccharide pyruvyl transferase family protein n=1 Tax=Skermanella cutis TaxID=2775420 RepID=A0ABX7B204_9PROT|nr:polysaccharide pyruvyl transferase family protein [Skermanella sp. TT6]QQP88363.1 polysaccharide pyruvyl transferase family protein [Skermanella sp. TT6]
MPIVGISGSYGGLNLGDEAILASAIVQLRNALPGVEIVAFSRNAEHTRANQDVDHAINPRTALRDEIIPEVERLDVLLLGGGGILYDTEARTYLREVVIAQARNVPTFAFSVGIGPLKGGEERAAVRDGMNMMTGITVREIGAKRLLEEIGCTRPVTVTADPALLLDPAPFTDDMLRAEGIPADRRLIGLSIRERGAAAPDLDAGGYHGLLAQAADFIVHRYDAQVVFVPMERADLREAHQVIAAMSAPHCASVLRGSYSPREILGLMGHFQFALGMRLHFLIFAAISGVPLMALPYASKVADFLDVLGVPRRAGVHEDGAGSLLAALDRLWDNREDHCREVRERVVLLQGQARRTVPLMVETLNLRSAAPVDS